VRGFEVQGGKLAVKFFCGFVISFSGEDFVVETAEGDAFAVEGNLGAPFL